ATETQVCYLSPAEARLIVAKHRRVPADAHTPLMGADQHLSPGHAASGDMSDPLEELVTLRHAADRGIVPWSHAAAKKRLQRSANAPEQAGKDGQAHTYRVGDLVAWIESELVP